MNGKLFSTLHILKMWSNLIKGKNVSLQSAMMALLGIRRMQHYNGFGGLLQGCSHFCWWAGLLRAEDKESWKMRVLIGVLCPAICCQARPQGKKVLVRSVLWVDGRRTLSLGLSCSLGVWTQSFALASQALYHLSHATDILCFSYFSNRVCALSPDWPQTMIFLPLPPI
jgi:hypothetical protein